VLYTIATGLSRGARASVVAAFGCTLGIVPHMAAAIMGLAALLHTSAIAFQTMKYLGVAYLLYMAWMTLKEHGALKVEETVDQKTAMQVIVHAILINILNPKLSIFFFAFLPQFVTADEVAPVLRMSELSAVFMLMTFVVFVGYGLFAAAVRRHVISRPAVLTWMRRAFAGRLCRAGSEASAGGSMTPSRFRWFRRLPSVCDHHRQLHRPRRDLLCHPGDPARARLLATESGAILGAFGFGYALTTLLGGFAVDRWGARIVLTIAAVLWSLSIGMTALAPAWPALRARVLLGVSEGPNFPALTGAVTHWLSPHERATALGNALLAVPLALAVGGPVVTQLLAWLDWRLTFAVLFALSAAWVPLWWFLFRDSPADSASSTRPSSTISRAITRRSPDARAPSSGPGPA
jgi:threonine/homoserine/homoserine lactone efflux protein